MVIKRYQVILIFSLLFPATMAAADNQCLDKTCVDVFTQDNQLIITAAKNGVKPTDAPRKRAVVKPKPVVSKRITPKPVSKPIVKKVVLKPKPKLAPVKRSATASLSDRLIKLLPIGDVNFQPDQDALVNMPV